MFENPFSKPVEERKNVEIFDEEVKELVNMLDDTLKASGVSFSDMVNGFDEESGALFGRVCTSYKKIMKLAREQAEIVDSMNAKLDRLGSLNEDLLRKIDSLMDQVKKVGKEK